MPSLRLIEMNTIVYKILLFISFSFLSRFLLKKDGFIVHQALSIEAKNYSYNRRP